MSGKNRSFVVTYNNPKITLEDLGKLLESDESVKYYVFGSEVAPTTGTPHFQGYVTFKNPRSISGVNKKFFGNKARLEVAKGTAEENRVYCTKDNNFVEGGEMPKPGRRTDIKNIKDLRLKERCTVRELLAMEVEDDEGEAKPIIRNLQQLRFAEGLSKYMPLRQRDVPEVIWLWGATGTGKTKTAFEICGEDTWVNNGGLRWFDGYDEHENVIFDDFRSEHCEFEFLLRLLDRYPLRVEVKGGYVNWVPKRIVVTAPYKPEEMFGFLGEIENLKQLLRRITEIREIK